MNGGVKKKQSLQGLLSWLAVLSFLHASAVALVQLRFLIPFRNLMMPLFLLAESNKCQNAWSLTLYVGASRRIILLQNTNLTVRFVLKADGQMAQ